MTVHALIRRDGDVCIWCGRKLWPRDLTAEHLLPRARHGHALAENLAVACRACNKRRGTRSVTAYVRAQLGAGEQPPVDLLLQALERLRESRSRRHAEYACRELHLLGRLG
jgi:5-methylcytosine-specific restriction endonuclease McrA